MLTDTHNKSPRGPFHQSSGIMFHAISEKHVDGEVTVLAVYFPAKDSFSYTIRVIEVANTIEYPFYSASACRIAWKAAIATSSIFSSGWRVVRDCRARLGLTMKRTKGFEMWLAVQRRYS